MFYFTLHFKMFTREEIFKMAEENVSIAKYLKPKARPTFYKEEQKRVDEIPCLRREIIDELENISPERYNLFHLHISLIPCGIEQMLIVY